MPKKEPAVSYTPLDEISSAPPSNNELEISLFGPGVGECLLLHLGDNYWIVIDSCQKKGSKQSIIVDYLDSLGLDPADSIKKIIITHWHNDHIRGIADLVRRCPNSIVYHPAAHRPDEYVKLVETLSPTGLYVDRETNGIKELGGVLRELASRANKDNTYVQDKFRQVCVDREIYSRQLNGHLVRIKALSPCDVELTASLQEIANIIPAAKSQRCVLPRPDRNISAVALWIEFGTFSALLGSDLEETTDPNTGWSVIVRDQDFQNKASVFKIPHHGSRNAHCEAVWNDLVQSGPVSITTAFSSSDLPSKNDVARISQRSSIFACTSPPKRSAPRRNPAVERVLREVAKERKTVKGKMGHIQIRVSLDGTVELRGNPHAAKLRITTHDSD